MATNIKYNFNKNEFNNIFFKNCSTFLFLNDCISNNGYFAFGYKDMFITDFNKNVDFKKLDKFVSIKNEWKFGFITYDVKNDIENLYSNNVDEIYMPKLCFFIPQTLLRYEKGKFNLVYGDKNLIRYAEYFLLYKCKSKSNTKLKPRITKKEYLQKVINLQNQISIGNIYEINFCYEYYNPNSDINPISLYNNLTPLTKAPFSAIGKFNNHFIISASPERFIKKQDEKIISQPIKGTTKRGVNKQEDKKLKTKLSNDPKERSENIMIVDLVRNDLSKIGKYDSVKVDELCKIYTFESVHQMISTVSCKLNKGESFSNIIKATFPMGSMTGAPKIKAMQLIEKEEYSKRGLYSGTVGYIDPKNNFDFNVIIRSFLYNNKTKYISTMVGGAITAKSNPEKEYEETIIKIKPLLDAISNE